MDLEDGGAVATGTLDGHVALVTGAAQGIGAAIARVLGREGATLVLTDVDEAGVDRLAGELGGRALRHDVASPESWRATRDAVLEELGRLDVLVNNAGISAPTPMTAEPWEAYLRVVSVNQHGPFLGMQTFLPDMVAAGRGSVVNIASINALRGVPGMSAYCASKHAVLGMTRSAALELATTGVRLNCVCPGMVVTEMGARLSPTLFDPQNPTIRDMIPVGHAADPGEVAEVVAFLASDRASYCTGAHFVVDGAWTAGLKLPEPPPPSRA